MWKEEEVEWRPPSSDILKSSINYDCNNSIPINFTEAWSFFQSSDMTTYYVSL